MNLHEYQAKQLFSRYGLLIPKATLCRSLEETRVWLDTFRINFDTTHWVAKCQIHAGGRGLADGILKVQNQHELLAFIDHWLGRRLTTCQTRPEGLPVNSILIEAEEKIMKAFYLSVFVDRGAHALLAIASPHGGVDVEQNVACHSEAITAVIHPDNGPNQAQGHKLARALGLQDEESIAKFTDVFIKLATLALEKDLTLAEINPLICTPENRFVCLDAKMIIDDNALYRHPELMRLRDSSQEDSREYLAAQQGFSYVSLEGNIGCMVNGAGLAMATMDTISLYGGQPANFLDVGGSTTAVRVADAFQLVVSDPKVQGVLVNIFGGIVRCDMIAEGIINALLPMNLSLPIVVRLEGNKAECAKKMLSESTLNIINADHLDDAAKKILSVVNTPAYVMVREKGHANIN